MAKLTIEGRREVEMIMALPEDEQRAKLYEWFEDHEKFGRLVATTHFEGLSLLKACEAYLAQLSALEKAWGPMPHIATCVCPDCRIRACVKACRAGSYPIPTP